LEYLILSQANHAYFLLLEFLSRLFLFVLLAVEPVLLVLCIVSLCVRGEQTLHRADFSLFVDQILG
jgi:hypothetical protein